MTVENICEILTKISSCVGKAMNYPGTNTSVPKFGQIS